ncbi:hypothetical protein [Thioclava pacifica]|uniref:Lipoprotein n=1 Tax=Thioclava pacifica DSM 10166 TaxID=1353537 RepID=A0A074K4J6_9RHOB|nr:hypothetical protein [Thioclava pacifica]KEO56507.1 hypothetical protein TP2_02980 [Thioclava pacifica DSM 10166]
MKNLLIILGVTGLLAGCDMMQPAASDAPDEAAMAASSEAADATSGTHEQTESHDRDQASNPN